MTTPLTACGSKGESDGKPATTSAKSATKAAPAKAPAPSKSIDTLSDADVVAFGETIFKAQGGNSCNDCHGMAGHNGRLSQAADLRKPTTWKAHKTTAGDPAKFEAAIVELIRYGAGPWNAKHEAPTYDVTMLGVAQGPSKSALRKVRKTLKKKHGIVLDKTQALDFGARATYAYVETLWEEKLGAPSAAPSDPPAAKEVAPK